MRYLILLGFVFCHLSSYAFKEYLTIESYLKENPTGKHDGTDGNWIKADRKHRNMVWDKANETNLVKKDGFKAYQRIWERADFYKWFQEKTEGLGFKTRWPKLACTITHRLSFLLGTLPSITGNSNKEIKAFIIKGNELIFVDNWPILQELRFGKVLSYQEARDWDAEALLMEQQLIHPFYLKLSKQSLNKFEKLLRKEAFLTQFLPGITFDGSLLSIEDVCAYGMKMMGY